MAERERAQIPLDGLVGINEPNPLDPKKLDDCPLEGIDGKPSDCPNNPLKHPENHRPQICSGCPDNPELWKVAEMPT